MPMKIFYLFMCVSIFIGILECFDHNEDDVATGPSVVQLKLRLNYTTRKLFLDVYNPESLVGYTSNITDMSVVTNPSCQLEDGPIREVPRKVKVEFYKILNWSDANNDHSELKYSLTKAVFKVIVEGNGYLQCTAKVKGDMDDVVSERLLKRNANHIFALKVVYKCNPVECSNISYWLAQGSNFSRCLNKSLYPLTLPVDNFIAVPVKLEPISPSTVSVIYHVQVFMNDRNKVDPRRLSTFDVNRLIQTKTQPHQLISEKETDLELKQSIQSIVSMMKHKSPLCTSEVLYVRSTKFCHDGFREAKMNDTSTVLHWPATELGQKATPIELCVTQGNTLPILECVGNFTVGTFWSQEGTVFECQATSKRTSLLHQLAINKSSPDVLKILENRLLPDPIQRVKKTNASEAPLSPAEIKFVADLIANIEPSKIKSKDLLLLANITNSIMTVPDLGQETDIYNKNNLKIAQQNSNSSNIILDSLDRILSNVDLTNKTELIVTKKLVTLAVDLSSKNTDGIFGVAVLKNTNTQQDYQYFRHEDILPLNSSHTTDTLIDMDVVSAVLIPQELFKYDNKSHRLVVNLFYDDSLFGSSHLGRRMNHIISVTIDGKRYPDLNPPLVLIFENENRRSVHFNMTNDFLNNGRSCVFWDFLSNAGEGGWSDTGCTLANPSSQDTTHNKDVCICTHLTHFGELLREYPLNFEDNSIHVFTLDLITICGCVLSLFGLFGVALTAMVFPEWRQGTSRRIQLSLCAALGMLMLSFLSLSFTRDTPKDADLLMTCTCIITGLSLHYSIVASFCWMIVAAWGQYFRLAKPFASLNRRPHFLMKASLFAWGLPAVPCLIILILNPEIYNPPSCYPTGKYLYFSVVLPVVLAVSINATIYIRILCAIYNCCGFGSTLVHLRHNQCERRVALRKLLTTVFLFMLLGLSWVFGLMHMNYIFCATASLQGLVVFIFFIVVEKNTRERWSEIVSQRKSDKLGLARSSVSADFIRRWSYGHQRPHRSVTTRISVISD